MKISEQWLREWVNLSLNAKQLSDKLTMSGLEVEDYSPVAEKFSKVVIGQILKFEKHPQADRLNVCLVTIGKRESLTIVCAATNVRENLKVPVALIGAELPDFHPIQKTELRGVLSHGMLCSTRDLALTEEANGLYELPQDAPVGQDLWKYLNLSDHIFDISITPNRGDCLSVKGLSMDIAAITNTRLRMLPIKPVKAKIKDQLSIEVKHPKECPRYVGRVIRGVKAGQASPIWLQERLRRSGIRSISPIVDVMNMVMLELGQPMHAFDLAKINGGIRVRKAAKGESLLLLDGNTVALDPETLLIADKNKPLAIAGVMGGLDSGVTLSTQDIFLESAYFHPETIARATRRYGLTSDSSYRFERGVDPLQTIDAIDYATKLILEIVGGQPGKVTENISRPALPKSRTIVLKKEKIHRLLGMIIPDATIKSILERLGFSVKKNKAGFQVIVPPRRSDITLEVDLIEEIIRLYGYEKIPTTYAAVSLQCPSYSEQQLSMNRLRHAFVDQGYQEVVTYSFVQSKLSKALNPKDEPIELVNPITSEMTVMRTSLWPGLINTLLYNQNRQQARAQFFETGLRFIREGSVVKQERVVGGLINGSALPEQWGIQKRAYDFFDLKGQLENLFKLTHARALFTFKPGQHAALHPGQTAEIHRDGHKIGVMGALHPSLLRQWGIQGSVYLFELLLGSLLPAKVPIAQEISKFPEIRRDIAILVDTAIPSQAIQDTIIEVGGEFLREVNLFDVYAGKGMPTDKKSIGLALTLQHSSRTLIDEEVVECMERILATLKNRFAADLRG